METGVYLNKEVQDIFDRMEKLPVPNSRKINKIISRLREKYSNAPQYIDKVTLSKDNLNVDNLTTVLGEFFFGSKKDTKANLDTFVTMFNNLAGTSSTKKSIEQTPRTENKPGPKTDTKSDAKSVMMKLSDDFWAVLEKIEKINDPVSWALIKFVEHDQKKPNSNVLAIKELDIDKDNPTLFSCVLANNKRTKIPVFNFLKQYFGNKFNNLELNEFAEELRKVVLTLSYEPGDVLEVKSFQYNPKDVKSTFISLVTETYPRGHEDEVVKYLDPNLEKDEFGNYFRVIGRSDVMFTSHLDTVSTKTDVKLISRIKEGQEFISSDGTTILGADDKAGVTVLHYMMAHNIPGVYYFFVGEESGGIGSGKVAESIKRIPHLKGIKKCVSFDRRNYYSVITSQMYDVCCSDEFAEALCVELNKSGLKMGLDPTGVFTDSANFIEHIPECTNISVGYFNEHTKKEALNITFLKKLAEACIKVDWSNLPIVRTVELSEEMLDSWDDVLTLLEDTGFYNEIKVSGDKNRLIIKMDFEQSSFSEAHTDVKNLEYIFTQMNIEPRITFDNTIIKFELI